MKTVLCCVLASMLLGNAYSGESNAAEVELKDVKEQATLVIKAEKVKPQDIGPTLMKLTPKVCAYLDAQKIKATGAPFTNYTRMYDDGSLDLEAGFPVPEGTKGEGDVVASKLEGGQAATITHVGPYSKLNETWDKLKKWLDQSKRAKGRDSCEVYIDIENEGKKKEAELKTTVYILLKKE